MKKIHFIIFIVTSLFILFSCKKETELPLNMGYRYFPINTGHWMIYDVDSVSYNDFTGQIDSFSYQIKEVIESVFIDNSGNETQRIERYVRENDTSEWIIRDVWYQNRTTTTAERVEENLRFVKLIFPVETGKKWDGNSFNTLSPQTYELQETHSSKTINGNYFDSTVTVLQKSFYTIISEDFQQEIFATRIGMVYKKYTALTKSPAGLITSGIEYTYTLHTYGN